MSISSDRIERAENEAVKIFEAHTHYVIGETRGGVPLDGFIRSKLERAIADAIAAAEARGKVDGKMDGLVEAGRMISGYRETVPGREPGPLAQIDARIAALQAERDKTT